MNPCWLQFTSVLAHVHQLAGAFAADMIGPIKGNNLPKNTLGNQNLTDGRLKISPEPSFFGASS